jgi:hypothetical protein
MRPKRSNRAQRHRAAAFPGPNGRSPPALTRALAKPPRPPACGGASPGTPPGPPADVYGCHAHMTRDTRHVCMGHMHTRHATHSAVALVGGAGRLARWRAGRAPRPSTGRRPHSYAATHQRKKQSTARYGLFDVPQSQGRTSRARPTTPPTTAPTMMPVLLFSLGPYSCTVPDVTDTTLCGGAAHGQTDRRARASQLLRLLHSRGTTASDARCSVCQSDVSAEGVLAQRPCAAWV